MLLVIKNQQRNKAVSKTYASMAGAKRYAKTNNINAKFITLDNGKVKVCDLDTPRYNAGLRKRSTVEGPVAIIRAICQKHYGKLPRKEIIGKAVAAGVNPSTAAARYAKHQRDAKQAEDAPMTWPVPKGETVVTGDVQ